MLHVPVVSSVAVLPETVQTLGVDDVKVTASPELAVALRVNAPASTLNDWVGMTANVTV
jgi:hypothetical protein